MDNIHNTLNNIATNAAAFQSLSEQMDELLHRAKELDYTMLAVHARKARDGLNGVVNCLEDVHSAIWQAVEPRNVPIIDKSRPKLTLIKGGENNVSKV